MSPMRSLPSTCDAIGELLEAHALDALEAAEQAQVEAHLATCERCRRAAAGFAEVTRLLPEALRLAAGQRPPAALRARVLRRIGADTQAQRTAAGPNGAIGQAPDLDAAPLGIRRPLRWRRERVVGLLAAAAVLAVALGGGVQLGTALARERALRLELALELAALVGQQEVVLEVVDARDGTRRLLRPAPGAPPEYARAYGKVFTRPDLPHVVAMVGRVPPPPPGQAYYLWLLLDGQTRLAGPVGINADGFGQLVFDADRNGPLYQAAWVTLQPAGSARGGPSGTTILRWDAPAGG